MFTKIKTYFTDLGTKIKADITNAIILISNIVSGIIAHIDSIAATMGAPEIVNQLGGVIHDAQVVAKYVFAVTVVAAIAKFKALVQSPPAPPPKA